MNIAQSLESARRLFPENEALVHDSGRLTYRELDEQVNRLSHGLSRAGILPGDRVALFLPNVPEFVLSYFAVQKVGAIAVSIGSSLKEAEVAHVLRDSGARMMVTTDDLLASVPEQGTSLERLLVVGRTTERGQPLSDWMTGNEGDFRAVEREWDDPAAILYTSGTTGEPRGATLSQGNLVSNTSSFAHHAGMTPDDRLLLFLPLFHCFAQNVVMNCAVNACATMVLKKGFAPPDIIGTIRQEKVTMFFGVPPAFQALLGMASPQDLTPVRFCLSGAAILPVEVGRKWQEKFGIPISIGYGATETSPFASFNSRFRFKHGSIGTPGDGIEMRVVDTDGNEVPTGELGEIVVKGPNIMLGYWNREAETAEAIRNGWFHTGDIGRCDEEGYFHVVDRVKDMVNVGGMKVFPAEVEAVILDHPAVAEVAVYAMPDGTMGELVMASVVLRPGEQAKPSELIDHAKERLADYKVPGRLDLVDEIPKSPTGKYLKKVLRAAVAGEVGETSDHGAEAPDASTIQRWIIDWLRERIGYDGEIGLREPFQNFGVSSLQAVNLVAELQRRLSLSIPPTATWNHVDIESLASFLHKEKSGGEAVPTTAAESAEHDEDLERLSDTELEAELLKEISKED